MNPVFFREKKNFDFFFKKKEQGFLYLDSRNFDIKPFFYQIIKNLEQTNIKIMFWKAFSILKVFVKFLDKNSKNFELKPDEKLVFFDRKFKKNVKLTNKEETWPPHDSKISSSKEFDLSNESWLNKIKDWDPPGLQEKKNLTNEPKPMALDLLKKNLNRNFNRNFVNEPNLLKINNRVYQKINKNTNRLNSANKYSAVTSYRNFTLEEKTSFCKSYLRVKLDKIHLIWFKEKEQINIFSQPNYFSRRSNVFDVGKKEIEISKPKTQMFGLLKQRKITQNISNTKKSLDGCLFSNKDLVIEKFCSSNNYFKTLSPLKTPVIFQNTQNRILKSGIFEINNINKFLISRFNNLLKHKIIFKQFNPYGDIYSFFSK